MLGRRPPFYRPGRVLMGPDHGAVEDQPLQVGVLQRLEEPEPDALGGPAIEPPPDRVRLAEALGQVAPGCSGLADPEHGVDEESVVLGGHARVARPAREEILDPFPVFMRYRVTMHRAPLSGSGTANRPADLTQISQILSTRPSDIHSLSNFKRNTPEFIRQMKESGRPVVLTINGKAELVVQDPASYQKLVELAERAERMDALQASIEDMRAGRVIPAESMLTEMRQILAEKR
jgi:PHD/YefM family antitoxin component YafN of YafNO toxin-antitoxin module